MSLIEEALNSGHSVESILSFLTNTMPSFKKKIKRALALGHDAKEVLSVINQQMETGKRPANATESERVAFQRDEQKRRRKKALGATAAVAAPFALGALAPRIGAALGIGSDLFGGQQQEGQQQQQPDQQTGSMFQRALNQLRQITQPQAPPTTTRAERGLTRSSLISDLGLEEDILKMAKEGMTPEQISSYLEKALPDEKRKIVKKRSETENEPFALTVKNFLTTEEGFGRPEIFEEEQVEEIPETAEPEKTQELEEPPDEPGLIETGELVADPKTNAIGILKHKQRTKALLDDDGKLKQVATDDLIQSPLPPKDLADLHDELIHGIERDTGQDVSRNVNWAGYDPERNELVYHPWDGSLYLYDDISESDKEELTNILSKRKTTGENHIGAWEAGTASPIGAAMSSLIQRLQKERGGKGKEYKAKFQTIYDALEPAIKAAKKRRRERKKEEARKKKKGKK